MNAALVVVGRVMRPFGIRGELKVALETDFPDVLRQRRELIVTRDGVSGSPAAVESVRMHQGAALVKLSGVDTRTDAEDLRGALLAVREEDRPELEEGRFWLDDIIGLEAVFEDGRSIGVITEVLTGLANDVWVAGKVLIPAVSEFIVRVDLEGRRVVVRDIAGLTGE
ncbi:MAG: ribosome maturation factor RimM [Armatimonadota bacterium]